MTKFLTLQPVKRILDFINEFEPLPREKIPLSAGLNRILAKPFNAPHDLPGFNRATMDGFAVRAKDVYGASEGMPALLEIIGECPMGAIADFSLKAGQAVRIWTGGMLPPGADAVVMLEYSRPVSAKQVELTKAAAFLENVVAHDEDAQKNEELLSAGCILRPQELGLLAAFGQENILVHRKPKVAVISTGDEVRPINEDIKPGQVRDINSYTLPAQAIAQGAEATCLGLVADDQELLRQKVRQGLSFADVLLLSGGSSAGLRDYTLNTFSSIAEILAHGVAISPGKPLIMARKGAQSLWGLPGHPASALICAEVFIRPLLHRLSGRASSEIWRNAFKAVMTRPVASAQGRRDYIRVQLGLPQEPGGLLTATPIMGKSGLISTLSKADALAICPENLEGLAAGQVVDLQPW